jgi:hypothetical protein
MPRTPGPSVAAALLSYCAISCAPAAPPPPDTSRPTPSARPSSPVVSLDTATAPAAPPTSAQTPKPQLAPAEVVAQQLAIAWCREAFNGPPMETPTDCAKIAITIGEERDEGGVESAVIALHVSDMFEAEARFVFLRAGDEAAVFRLGNVWSSGVGGNSHAIGVENVQVANVFGEDAPEWWAEVATGEHTTSTGLCLESGNLRRTLVLCTSEGGFACVYLPIVLVGYEDHLPLGSPRDPCPPPGRSGMGFANAARVANGNVAITPSKKTLGERVITKHHKAPFTGTIPIAKLFATSKSENLCVSKKLSCPH